MSVMRVPVAVALSCALCVSSAGYCQPASSAASPQPGDGPSAERVENGAPIAGLIATVAKKTGKKFVLDPRVRGDVRIVGQDPASVSYNDLLTILHIYDYDAVEYGGYVNVLPIAAARQEASPLLTGKESRPDSEIVTKVITVKNVSAAQLVPILRPLIPQYGHLAAYPCTNKLILVDTFGNVKRLEAMIESIDVGEPYKSEKCAGGAPERP